MTNREKLEEAVRLISSARANLQQETIPCEACGLHVKTNWSEYQAAETLKGVRQKLNRLVDHEGLQDWLDCGSATAL